MPRVLQGVHSVGRTGDVERGLGLSLPNRAILFGVSPQDLLEAAVLAEESELFTSVWVGDSYLGTPRLQAIPLLGALAVKTRRLQIGTICLASFTQRHPLTVAVEWASLDVLSSGRTMLGVCSGNPPDAGERYRKEWDALGIQPRHRIGRLEEAIPILRQAWEGRVGPHKGTHFDFDEIEVLPIPAQSSIPILIAVNPARDASPRVVERALRRVARLADGWQTDGTPPEVFRDRWNAIRAFAQEYERREQLRYASVHLMVNISDHSARGRETALEFLEQHYGVGRFSPEKLDAWLAVGPADVVGQRIREFIDAGANTPILRFASPDQLGQIERFVGEVGPYLDHHMTT